MKERFPVADGKVRISMNRAHANAPTSAPEVPGASLRLFLNA